MNKHHVVSSFLMLLLFFPLLWISQYNYPSGDDFAMFLKAQEFGALGATKWWYFNGCGRYSYSFIQSFVSSHGDWLAIYKAFPMMIFLMGFGCVWYFLKAFFGSEFNNKLLFTLSVALYAFLVSITPDISTGFYWLTTSIQYLGAVFTSLLILALYINLTHATQSLSKALSAFLIVFLIFILAGLNEASALLLIATFGWISFFYSLKFRRFHKWGLTFLAFSVLFGLLSFLSPGTHLRLVQTGAETHLLNILVGSVGLTVYLLVELLTSTPLLLVSLIYLAFLNANRDKLSRPAALLFGVRWYWILLSMLLAVTAVNGVIFTAIGVNGLVDRLKNIYVYSIAIGWFLLLTALFIGIAPEKFNFHLPKWIIGVLTAFLFGFLVTGFELKLNNKNNAPSSYRTQKIFSMIKTKSVYANAYLDIFSGRAERYYSQNEERRRELVGASGTVDFSLYSFVPETIFIQDVNHPFGHPSALSKTISGEDKHLRYVETGPPAPIKERF